MKNLLFGFLLVLSAGACVSDDDSMQTEQGDLTQIEYEPTYEEAPHPVNHPKMPIPEDNLLTTQGIELGRHLFYDPILSRDSSISCESCHEIHLSFSDGLAKSVGIDGRMVDRSSMSLLNVGYFTNGLFWDGRAATLEELVTHPIEDFREMDADWPMIEEKLQRSQMYPALFRKAFGIANIEEIKRPLVEKALAQFMRIIVSSGESIFDQVMADNSNIAFTEEEANGFQMFFLEGQSGVPDAGCFHCHNRPLFTDNTYSNNGIQDEVSDYNFADNGRGQVTGTRFDNGKMRVPSLRNILLTAPYMHDGRFETIEEVIDHYDKGVKVTSTTDPTLLEGIHNFDLTEEQKSHLVAFLSTLTDTAALNNPRLSNPFVE